MITATDIQFYKNNGYLIVSNFLSEQKIDSLNFNYNLLRKKLARQAGIKEVDYEREISQIRDIWKYDDTFRSLILEKEIAKAAPLFFEDNSCRLLHDHIINKPLGNNGIVPWHQDYTYWPTDNPNGLSFWLPFSDLDKDAGVLEVVPSSHLWGEEKPVDFMNDTKDFSTNYSTLHLSVKKGDLVILNALTWHRSATNISTPERKAYISLWIPTDSKYAPKHASWHPVNDNIKVQKNEILNEDWFPVIGSKVAQTAAHTYLDNSMTESMSKITMYNASKIIKQFLCQHLPLQENIWSSLYKKEKREQAVDILLRKFHLKKAYKEDLDEILFSMAINGLAYQDHRARNVYNKSYIRFKKILKDVI